jgi:anti-sigma-K factor RskA
MSYRNQNIDQRAEELLLDQAICGLSDADQAELEALLAGTLSANAAESLQDEFMQTAALVQLGMAELESQKHERLPAHIRERIMASAPDSAHRSQNTTRNYSRAKVVPISAARPVAEPAVAAHKASVWRNPALGWAAAAMLAIALVNFRTDLVSPDENFAQGRSSLMASASDLLDAPWATSEIVEYQQVTGDVVWSDAEQKGYMRLAGMPANNPTRQQYQLWIVDPERSAQPVDGGVFDIPPGATEMIVPINAKLNVSRPTAFAITLEKPGGVVVSAGPLLVVAPVTGAG